MKKQKNIIAFLLAIFVSSQYCVAQSLKIGDPAPKIKPKSWIKGEPVLEYQPGTVYVVEFWATWCIPCIANIPHLTELAKKYQGQLTIIGISSREGEMSTGKESTVRTFVEKMGNKMAYTVAMDDPTQNETYKLWMDASGVAGVPAAFVVDKTGRLVWLGHPSPSDHQLEEAIKMAISGTIDLVEMKKKQAEMYEEDRSYRLHRESKKFIRQMIEGRKYKELQESGIQLIRDTDETNKEIGAGQMFLSDIFLNPLEAESKFLSMLSTPDGNVYNNLFLVKDFADILPSSLVEKTIIALSNNTQRNGSILAELCFNSGRYSKAYEYFSNYFANLKPDQNKDYYEGQKKVLEKYRDAAMNGAK